MSRKYKIFFVILSAVEIGLFGLCLYLFASRSSSADSVFSEKKAKPRVSIITSVYNGDDFIEGFLEDITQQTIFNQCELIMINANSPGSEEPVIKRYMKKYPNIIYVKLDKDPGVYGVWNRAIRMAAADFISNANLDDRSHPEALEIQVKELELHPDIDLVYTGYVLTKKPNETFFYSHFYGKINSPDFSIKNMKKNLPGPRPVWRKSLHDRYGFFSEVFFCCGDSEMWLRAASLGAKFKKVSGYYVLYYENPKGISTEAGEKKKYHREMEKILIGQRYGYLFENLQVK